MLFQRLSSSHIGRAVLVGVFATLSLRGASAQSPPIADDPAAGSPASAPMTLPPIAGWFPEPRVMSRPLELATRMFGEDDDARKSGFYPELSNMNTGSGWISAGPGYRQYLFNDNILLEGSAALSWHLYKMVQGHVEAELVNNRVTVGSQAMWQDQTQVDYFGAGPDSLEADRSHYRIRTTDVVGYGVLHMTGWLAAAGEFGWLHRPELDSAGGTFLGDDPDTRDVFADEPGASDQFQPNYLHGQIDLTADTRDHKGHPSRGGLYRAAMTAYRDQGAGRFTFNQYEVDAEHFVPLAQARWVLAFRGSSVLSDVGPGHDIPFYLQPSLGGASTLRDYASYRFHDANTLVVNAESRWAVYEHVDLAAFFDAGNVAARASDLNLEKTSYGAGIRLHNGRTTFARLDVAQGAEGWRVVARTNDPLRLSRLSWRMARIPFAP
jgi:hypothetical protein